MHPCWPAGARICEFGNHSLVLGPRMPHSPTYFLGVPWTPLLETFLMCVRCVIIYYSYYSSSCLNCLKFCQSEPLLVGSMSWLSLPIILDSFLTPWLESLQAHHAFFFFFLLRNQDMTLSVLIVLRKMLLPPPPAFFLLRIFSVVGSIVGKKISAWFPVGVVPDC